MAQSPLHSLALSIERSQRIQFGTDGSAARGYETFIKKYVGMVESQLLAKLTGNANKLLDALALRARILADPRCPGSEEEFQTLKQMGVVTDQDRGELFCFASLERLAQDTGLSSLHTVEAGIAQLIDLKLVRKVSAKGQTRLASGRFGSNVYFIEPASYIGKFDAERPRTDGVDGCQKSPTVSAPAGDPPIMVDRAIKNEDKQKDEEQILLIAEHFAHGVGIPSYTPNDKEVRKITALRAEGYAVEDICAGITQVVDKAKAAGRQVRSIAYCLPGVREHTVQQAARKAGKGTLKPTAVSGTPPPESSAKVELAKLAAGDAELLDLLEIIQERNPGRPLGRSDVRAWQAVAGRFHDLATARETTPIGLVMQAVLKGIGANSDRGGFFAPSLAEAILENWQQERAENQPPTAEKEPSPPTNGQASSRREAHARLPSLHTADGASLNPTEMWGKALEELSGQMTKATFDTWVRATFVAEARDGDEPMLVIGTHHPYAVEWLEHRLKATVERTVVGILGRNATVQYRYCQ